MARNKKSAWNRASNVFCFKIPHSLIELVDKAVESGKYISRGDFVRTAIRMLIEKELANTNTQPKHNTSSIVSEVKEIELGESKGTDAGVEPEPTAVINTKAYKPGKLI